MASDVPALMARTAAPPPLRDPIYVRGEGDLPCDVLLLGERPGYHESCVGRPFIGDAGAELTRYLRGGRDRIHINNLVPTYTGSNDDKPTPEEIAEWTPRLEKLLRRARPRVVVTAGAYATRYFLGDVDMDHVHGLPHAVAGRPFLVLPVYHPAAGLHQPERYSWPLRTDYETVREAIAGVPLQPHRMRPVTRERHWTGRAAAEYLDACPKDAILAVDREGLAEAPECFTASFTDDDAALVRPSEPHGIVALHKAVSTAELTILHQALDDLRALWRVGIRPTRWIDTMILAYLAGEPQGLKTLGYRETRRQMDSFEDLTLPIDATNVALALAAGLDKFRRRWAVLGAPKRIVTSLKGMLSGKVTSTSLRARWSKSTFFSFVPLPPEPRWQDLPEKVGVPYACADAIETRRLYPIIKARAEAQVPRELIAIDHGVVPFLARIADVGLAVDTAVLDRLSGIFAREFDRTCDRIEALLGYPLNPLSAPAVSDVLFEDLGVTLTKPTKSRKHFRTADKYLKARKEEHAVIPLILRAREVAKLSGTYAERLPGMLRDGRYYPDYRYTRTPTGRLAEEVILLIPKHSARGKKIRRAFHAGDGHVLVSTDASQIEMRVMAYVSQDAVLLDVYRRGGDVHADTAHNLLGAPKRPEDQDESKHRLPAKTLNFGIINEMTAHGLSEQLQSHGLTGWDVDACEEFRRGWFRLHDGVADYRAHQQNHARRHGYIEDLYGRRIRIAHIRSSRDDIRARAERQCMSGIQAGAQGIMRKWVAAIWSALFVDRRWLASTSYLEPWNFLHDDVILEATAGWEKIIAKRMQDLLPQDLGDIPVTGDSKVGENWADLKKIK